MFRLCLCLCRHIMHCVEIRLSSTEAVEVPRWKAAIVPSYPFHGHKDIKSFIVSASPIFHRNQPILESKRRCSTIHSFWFESYWWIVWTSSIRSCLSSYLDCPTATSLHPSCISSDYTGSRLTNVNHIIWNYVATTYIRMGLRDKCTKMFVSLPIRKL